MTAVNWQLFVTPLIESGDAAANAIQVQNAMHFRELLGNYSRWHFHHPGPFFFYLFGAGEALFYYFLHVVPAPLNGEYLAQIAFNVICLFTTIYIFQINVKRPLLPALAAFISALFLFVVYTAIPYSAINPIWPPYMSIFCFLLLASSAASVAAGNWEHLPLLAFSGMAMIHAHVAQLLFATVLVGTAILSATVREFRRRTLSRALRRNRRYVVASLVIIGAFLLPIAIDWATHHPNNIDHIRAYLKEHGGERNSASTTLLYVASFFTFYRTPETALANPSATLRDVINPNALISVYWAVFIFILLFVVISCVGKPLKVPFFLRYVFAEIALITLLFLYWSWRITGGMYNFNGFFFFSVQLLALLGLASLISGVIGTRMQYRIQIALGCASAAPLLLLSNVLTSYPSDPDVLPIVSAIKAKHIRKVMLTMAPNRWPTAAGVASYLDRSGIYFCFGPDWEFTFGPKHTCTRASRLYDIGFSENRPTCNAPCSVIYSRPGVYITGATNPAFLTLPALVAANDPTHKALGFNAVEGDRTWSTKEGALQFYLAADGQDSGPYTLSVTGTMFPGRPVVVKVNGKSVGTISTSGRSTQVFRLGDRALIWGGANTVTFYVANAGPVGTDNRTLGYFFEDLLIRGSHPPKGRAFADSVVTTATEAEAGALVPDVTWHPDRGWGLNGYYPDIGHLSQGSIWGSWNHSDASTGTISSSIFSDRAGCVILPVGHGPSILHERARVTTADGRTVQEVPLDAATGKWEFYKVYYDSHIKEIRIIAEDDGTGWGEWLAVGQPRFCGTLDHKP